MSSFESLTLALADWFDTPRCNLPETLRLRVEKEFAPMPWDQLSPNQRRTVTLQLDYQHEPATEQDRQFWWDFFEGMEAVQKDIAQWEVTAAPTATELALREDRLKTLRQELAHMKLQESRSRTDYQPGGKRLVAGDAPSSTAQDEPAQYVAYPKALHQLADRLGATPEEIAAWVWLGPDDGGIGAYLNANELDPPPRFYFNLGNYGDAGDDHDYVMPLMACWFRKEVLDRYEPGHRYITGSALIARWSDRPGLKAEAFVQAKIRESRLSDLHPIYGFTQGTSSAEATSPPLISGLFKVADVEQIEAEDFPVDWAQDVRSAGSLDSSREQGVDAGAVVAASAFVQPLTQPQEEMISLTTAQEAGTAGAGGVASANPCSAFRCMENLRADELAIAFVGDITDAGLGANNMLEISARGTTKRVALAEINLADRRNGGPNGLAVILLGIATGRRLSHSSPNATKMKRLRDVLRSAFGLAGDPFQPYRQSDGWVPHFTVLDKRGAADERARRAGERRMESFDELAERGARVQQTHDSRRSFEAEDDDAGAWLQENARGDPA